MRPGAFNPPKLVFVEEDEWGNSVYHWRYEAPDGFWVEFTSGSLHLEGFQEYIIRRRDGVRAFVWGADTSIIHDYISEMDGNWEIEVAYPTHFQVVGYAEGFPMKSVHKELVALRQGLKRPLDWLRRGTTRPALSLNFASSFAAIRSRRLNLRGSHPRVPFSLLAQREASRAWVCIP